MKRILLPLLILISVYAQAQTTGTIQKTTATGTIRYSGSNGVDTLVKKTNTITINGTTKNLGASPNFTISGGDTTSLSNRINANTSSILTKQNTLVSGTNIKTINGASLLGSGDLVIGSDTVSLLTSPDAPEDIFGDDGDIYFWINGNELNFYQKESGTWTGKGGFTPSSGSTYTGSNGVTLVGSDFRSDTTYNRTVANSFTKAEVQTIAAGKIATTITDGVTTSAPNQNAVYDALALKQDKPISQALTDGSTITWDLSSGKIATVTLGGNRTLAITNPVANSYYQITIAQDATGSRTLTFPAVKWIGATAPTLTTTANAKDIITLYYDGTSYYANYGLNYN